jgi:hypothetical protein
MKRFYAIALAAMFGLIVGAPLLSKPAAASPALAGVSAPAALAKTDGLVSSAYYYRRGYYRRGYYRRGYYRRPYYRRYGYYGYRRPYYGGVVCRVRYTYYGPRRVCFRRW